jgi:hypothetical protein
MSARTSCYETINHRLTVARELYRFVANAPMKWGRGFCQGSRPRGSFETICHLARRQAVRQYVKSLVGSDSDADYVLQDVCMAILARRETAVGVHGISGWLRGIARNLVLRHWQAAEPLFSHCSTRLVRTSRASCAMSTSGRRRR